ncbi:hypothetical protein MMC10_010677 [Thelotrema lepadinum]|nr:hypothetical protein [Thelotrema lepadinum]
MSGPALEQASSNAVVEFTFEKVITSGNGAAEYANFVKKIEDWANKTLSKEYTDEPIAPKKKKARFRYHKKHVVDLRDAAVAFRDQTSDVSGYASFEAAAVSYREKLPAYADYLFFGGHEESEFFCVMDAGGEHEDLAYALWPFAKNWHADNFRSGQGLLELAERNPTSYNMYADISLEMSPYITFEQRDALIHR